jgi:palmitoyl-protein thioesterase
MGLSQGSLLARYIVESCPIAGHVRNYLSIGGPNMGVTDVPECQSGAICEYVNYVARNLVYFKLIQNYLGPAGYFRDPTHMDSYLTDSVFLPYLNNESGDDATKAAVKARFSALNAAMLVMFTEDSVVYPKESEWFQQLNLDLVTVEALEDSTFFKEDFIGLRSLIEAGKVELVSIVGDHLEFSAEDIDNSFVPFLLK